MWALFVLLNAPIVHLAARMARARGRRSTAWLWAAAVTGPLAPTALLLLGDRRRRAGAA